MIYTRISSDPNDTEKGVARQEQDCREYVADHKDMVLVGAPYCDNNVSAWSGADREEWNKVLGLVERGEIDGIVTWHLDRVVRRMNDLGVLLGLVKKHGIHVYSVKGGDVDLASPTGVMVAQIVTAVAEQESGHKGERVARAKRQHAEDGKPGSGPRPFGFRKDKITHDEGEAQALKDAVEAFLDDKPKHSLSKAVQVIRESGYPMTTRRLREIFLSGRIAGRRDYVSMEMRRARKDGKSPGYFYDVGMDSTDAVWDPIIDVPTWQAVRGILLQPDRQRAGARRSNSLLAGLAVCGQCGGYMTHGGDRYQCNPTHRSIGDTYACGGVSARSELINNSIRDICKAAILEMEEIKVQTVIAPNAKRRADLQAQRSELLEAHDGLIRIFGQTPMAQHDSGALRAQVAELNERFEAVEAELSDLDQFELDTAGLELRADLLDGGDEAMHRRVIHALIQEVIIYPVGKGKNRAKHPFPDSWDVWWRGSERPVREGMADTSVRAEVAARRAARAAAKPNDFDAR